MIAPLKIRVFDKNFNKKCDISAPKFATVTPRYNATGNATVGILLSDPAFQFTDPEQGYRLRIHDEFDQHVMSGRITTRRTSGPTMAGLVELDIDDDFAIFDEALGWVVPTNPITAQGTAGTNWTMTGAAETVLKTAVQLNMINRLGMPVVCAPDYGRGGTITANLRMDPLSELWPVIDGAGLSAAGIGVTVQQVGNHLVVDCYTPSPAVKVLTQESGVIQEWKSVERAHTASRVVIAGQGEGQLRLFRNLLASDDGDTREADTGRIIERYRDARDSNDPTVLYARGRETLAEGAAKVGISVTLSETENFRYGASGFRVGDQVSISIGGYIAATNVLTEATLSWTDSDGWKATPKIGDVDDSTDTLVVKAIKQLLRGIARDRRA